VMGDVTGDSPPGSSSPRCDVFVLSGYLAPTSSFLGLSLLERGCRTDSIHLRVAAQEGAETIESSRVRVRFDVDDNEMPTPTTASPSAKNSRTRTMGWFPPNA
jgi:hypothetical protein